MDDKRVCRLSVMIGNGKLLLLTLLTVVLLGFSGISQLQAGLVPEFAPIQSEPEPAGTPALSAAARESRSQLHPSGNRSSRGGYLCVNVKPKDARIRILNIKSEYQKGMLLAAGKYLLEISKLGYITKKEWVEIEDGQHKEIYYNLK